MRSPSPRRSACRTVAAATTSTSASCAMTRWPCATSSRQPGKSCTKRSSTRSAPRSRWRAAKATAWRPCPTSCWSRRPGCGAWNEDEEAPAGAPSPCGPPDGASVRRHDRELGIHRIRVRPPGLAGHALAERVALVPVGAVELFERLAVVTRGEVLVGALRGALLGGVLEGLDFLGVLRVLGGLLLTRLAGD